MAKLSANTIFKWVKNEIFNLWSKGEISIPITDGLTKDDCLVAYWQNDDEITVEFNGEKRTVPCNIKSKDVDYVARCIMQGFAQIYLNKNESINKKMNKNRVRLTESDLHRIIRESVKKVLNEIGDTDRGLDIIGRLAGRKAFSGRYKDYLDVCDYAKEKYKGDLHKQNKFIRGFHSEKDRLKYGE